uniref:Uncharacterized protein n=1 Tax=Arundo donax TaxID=35708 RepID=A0A0A9ALC5_ARUDO
MKLLISNVRESRNRKKKGTSDSLCYTVKSHVCNGSVEIAQH